jgi:hypothetical protein
METPLRSWRVIVSFATIWDFVEALCVVRSRDRFREDIKSLVKLRYCNTIAL